jgi:hypothetical protein
MNDGKCGAPFARTPEFNNRTTLRHAIAGVLAAGALIVGAGADARIVSVTMSAPTVAFGGFNFPGVGQYVKITGVAYAEVDPADPRNSLITDIALAQDQPAGLVNGLPQPGKTRRDKVGYTLNFYILKPANLAAVNPALSGYGKMMYEPPNRGGKTWTALGPRHGGGNDPATITNTTTLQNSFLMPSGYHVGVERMGATCHRRQHRNHADAGCRPADRQGPWWKHDNRTGLRIRHVRHDRSELSGGVAGQEPCDPHPPRSHQRHAGGGARDELAIQRRRNAISPLGREPSVSHDIYEFRYTAKDPISPASASLLSATSIPGSSTDQPPKATRWPGYIQRIYTEISSQPGRMLNDFREARVQRG